MEWLIEVHSKFELMPETLYHTVHIVDRYLSMRSVSRKILQLIGMSAMLIASKFEEIWALEAVVSDQEMENMIFFLAELALTQYELIWYCSSLVDASAVYVARCTLNKTPFWDETLKHHTGFS
ncbi:hypothetical protein IFM89_036028 [Coptis chinensis]|uniref:Cyclin-like domain-containing protein n=1 Tax=Coptis chinensis TaxID=261450 RepID=A0A835H7E9_9MAGN|nr:hypothetical protein IFM89_036028 [Coptis chinensis]